MDKNLWGRGPEMDVSQGGEDPVGGGPKVEDWGCVLYGPRRNGVLGIESKRPRSWRGPGGAAAGSSWPQEPRASEGQNFSSGSGKEACQGMRLSQGRSR